MPLKISSPKINKENKRRFYIFSFVFILAISITFSNSFLNINTINAETVKELENRINDQKNRLEQLNKEIQENRKKLLETNQQANTLQSTVNSLNATEKKLQSDISYTKSNIGKTELEIQKITLEIDQKEDEIDLLSKSISEALLEYKEAKSESLLETVILDGDLSRFWNRLEQLESFQSKIRNKINTLKGLNIELEQKHQESESEKKELESLATELSGQREAVQYTKQEKQELLVETRSVEQTYQQIVAQKEAQARQFEQEILEIESKIQLLIDPNSFPGAKNGILDWPVDSVFITQQFGGSQFSKQNPHIYGRPFHPGTDFRAPIGTKIKSVSDGTVEATGNTDAYPGCLAWGKWVLVKHDNGLTSLYAHLSSILVNSGQRVSAGDSIALSGNTGISTGPHLHLGLYASQGIEVRQYAGTGSGCAKAGAIGPFADLDAYLDPMDYLPTL